MQKYVTGALLTALSANVMAMDFSANGDVRFGYYSLDRDTRSGSQDTTDEFRLRLRAGVTTNFNEQWRARVRFAGRYSTDDRNHPHFEIFDSIPAGDGLRRGDSTLDEIHVGYKGEQWELIAGRFQSKFELEGVAKKSLDRVTSPNVDITWTDGVQLKHRADNGWVTTFIAQHNDEDGPTEVRRSPLDFTDDGSRVSYFVSLENKQQHFGGIVQRTLDVSYLPDALHTRGVGAGDIDDYVAIVGRLAAKWPLGNNGMAFMLAGELGYAPNTPKRAAVGTGTTGDADGLAGQVSFNLLDIVPGHSAALVVGRVEDGYLLSPDFRNNNTLIEARYKWKIAKNQSFAARLRKRTEIDRRVGAIDRQEDLDYYLRYTYKF